MVIKTIYGTGTHIGGYIHTCVVGIRVHIINKLVKNTHKHSHTNTLTNTPTTYKKGKNTDKHLISILNRHTVFVIS